LLIFRGKIEIYFLDEGIIFLDYVSFIVFFLENNFEIDIKFLSLLKVQLLFLFSAFFD